MKRAGKKARTKATLDGIALSVDNLAIATAKGFDGVHIRIDEVEKRLDTKIDILDQKINAVHHAVLNLSYDYGKIKIRLENMELKLFGSIQES